MISKYSKELLLSNIIGSNPTGIIDNNINKNINIIQNTKIASKENLIKAQNNEIICNSIEKFQNKNNIKNFYIFVFYIFVIILFLYFYLYFF
jgi:hypothetical protein